MSPEQAVGEMSAIGPPSDCYALGVMLYELVSKHRPFSGDISTVLGGTLHEDPPPPSSWGVEIPKPLEAIVLKSLAKAVPDRYASAAAHRSGLGGYRTGSGERSDRSGGSQHAQADARANDPTRSIDADGSGFA